MIATVRSTVARIATDDVPARRHAPSVGGGSLVGPSSDVWLLGGLAIVAWVVLAVVGRAGRPIPATSPLVWSALFVGSMHFAMSYRLAYHERRTALRRHPVVLVVAPTTVGLALIVLSIAASAGSSTADDVVRAATELVFVLTMWHYVKQVYGVVRLAAGLSRFSFSRAEGHGIRFGLYPLWFISLMAYARGTTIVEVDGFAVRADLLPASVGVFRQTLMSLTIISLVVVFARAAKRNRRVPPATTVVPCVAAVLWVGMTPNLLVAVVMLPAFHALQYLACCHRAQHGLLHGATPTTSRQRWQLVQIFAAAACAGLLVTRWLPSLLTDLGWPDGGTRLGIILFAFLNLHHYLLDATIWRSGGELVQAVKGTRSAA